MSRKHTPQPQALFAYGEFSNVRLSPIELQRLYEKFGEDTAREWIETLSVGKAAKGYQYQSDYAAILNWSRRQNKKEYVKEPVIARLARPEPLCCLEHSGLSDEEFRHFMGDDD
jgi:hypothetical protein